jgi:hypothetical protein
MLRLARGSALLLTGIVLGASLALLVDPGGDGDDTEVSSGPRLGEAAVHVLAARAAEDQLLKIADLASLDGNPVTVSDLELRETKFAWRSRELASSVSSYRYGTSEPADLWLVSYRASDVEMPDWGITDGVVEVRVVLSDVTGEVVAADVMRLNPDSTA